LQADLNAIEVDMKGDGRILVRPSGTEALIRVMVEARTDKLLTRTMNALILRIQQESENN
jgi:phosphoglucosamine mutase